MFGPERIGGINEGTCMKSEAYLVENRCESNLQWTIGRQMRRRAEISDGESSSNGHKKKIDPMTIFAKHMASRREVKHQVTELCQCQGREAKRQINDLGLTPFRCKSR
eukprot:11772803-Karenia_brevis.AAC.1